MGTMADVALRAGVSISTVSHVLNGTRKVSPATVRAVEDAVQAVGYTPNILARALARSTTNTIGLALSAVSNHYFSEIVRAIEAECTRHGLMILLTDTHDDPAYELKVVQALHQRRVDGIVLAPAADPEQRVLRYLADNRLPTVLIDRLVSDRFDQIGVENKRATIELVHHLIGHGHRRIGLVSGLDGLATTMERVDGYRAALRAAGLPFDPDLVQSGGSIVDPARAACRHLLELRRPADRHRHRQQPDDHRRHARAARRRPPGAGGRGAGRLRRFRLGRLLQPAPDRHGAAVRADRQSCRPAADPAPG